MAFVKRKITIRFSLGEGQFGESGAETVEVSDIRVSAQITKTGGISNSVASLRIWGLPLDIMKRLTVQNKLSYAEQRLNSVTVLAGDDENGMAVCFQGTISEAWADFNSMPEAFFLVTAQTGLYERTVPVAPVSFNGTVDLVTMISGVAAQMNRALQNNGVQSVAVNPYYAGSLMDQLQAMTRDYEINCEMDDANIYIWPAGGARDSETRIVSAETGMVGYPTFTQNTIAIQMAFDPAIAFGQTIQVDSTIVSADGRWSIASVVHNIESEVIGGGAWFTEIECGLFGQVGPLVT